MDFIARAGSLLDKSHRIAGILLVIVAMQTAVILWQANNNSTISRHLTYMRETMPVYVVPGSTADIYRPESSDMLINAFVDFMTQSLYTYTYESYSGQYAEVKKFFTSEMLRFADGFFAKKISNAQQVRGSELFIPDRRTFKIENTQENGEDLRQVSVRGSVQQIINGSVVQTRPVEFSIKLRKVLVSRANPFGFMVLSLLTRELGDNE
ncbi:MAG: hypothetical protein WAX89_04435 [Alphaproteobacteria bacterium]